MRLYTDKRGYTRRICRACDNHRSLIRYYCKVHHWVPMPLLLGAA